MEQVFANAVHHPTLFAYHLPEHIRVHMTLEGIQSDDDKAQVAAAPLGRTIPPLWKDFKAEVEKEYMHRLFEVSGGSVKEACRISGLSRARLYQLMNLYNTSATKQDPD
jgi:two-component system NtrC family response regulator